MPQKNPTLNGNVPEHCSVALLLIDVINDLEFPGGDALFPQALQAAQAIATLKGRARAANVPAIYVNDNFGRWRSDFRTLIKHCAGAVRGKAIVELLKPAEEDYFVLKPKHSGFYSTTLDILLEYLHVQTLVLTGFTANHCVLFTASDAYMRDLDLVVPSDCVATANDQETAAALAQMEKLLKTSTAPSTALDFDLLLHPTGS
jgi:nicotinamidase-related amidase